MKHFKIYAFALVLPFILAGLYLRILRWDWDHGLHFWKKP